MQADSAQREPGYAEAARHRISRPSRSTAAKLSLALLADIK